MAKNKGEQYNAVIPVSVRSRDTRNIAESIRVFPQPFAEGNYQASTTTRATEVDALGKIRTKHKYLTSEMKEIRSLYLKARKQRIYGCFADSWVAGQLGIGLLDLAELVEEMENILRNET